MRTVLRLAAVLTCVAPLTGCDVVHLAAQSDRVRGSFSRTLTVKGPVDISIRTGSGDIQIRTGAAERVEILGRVSAGRSWDADVADPAERVRRVEAAPPIVQEGNIIRIGDTQDDRRYNNVSISYELVVPANTQVSAKTGSGDQMIGSVDGAVRAQTGSGDIRVERTGGSLDAQTGSGDISAASVGGAVRVQTGSGDVEVSQIVRGDVQVRTGSGDVVLNLPPDAAYSLDASTGSGGISTSQPITIQGQVRRNHIQGTVRGGGNAVRVRTGSGSIEIR